MEKIPYRVAAFVCGAAMFAGGTTNAPYASGFVDATNGDFRLLPDAAILKACPAFRPLPLARIPSIRFL